MKRNTHSRWLVLSAMVVGLLCQTGPCAVNTAEDADEIAQQIGLFLQQSATNAVADIYNCTIVDATIGLDTSQALREGDFGSLSQWVAAPTPFLSEFSHPSNLS